jgi:osmotically-inducible protein OsmY
MGITPVSDQSITQQVQNKLSGRGLSSPCHFTVETRKGEVTLSGSVQYAHQKGTAVQVANVISGVRRVIDRLIVKVPAKY